jgi:hypothetical protein
MISPHREPGNEHLPESAPFPSDVTKALEAHNVAGDAYFAAVESWAQLQADPNTLPEAVKAGDTAAKGAFEEMWRVDMRDGPVLADLPLEAWPDREPPTISPAQPPIISQAAEEISGVIETTYQPNWSIVPHSEVRRSRRTVRSLGSWVVSKVTNTMDKLRRQKS